MAIQKNNFRGKSTEAFYSFDVNQTVRDVIISRPDQDTFKLSNEEGFLYLHKHSARLWL